MRCRGSKARKRYRRDGLSSHCLVKRAGPAGQSQVVCVAGFRNRIGALHLSRCRGRQICEMRNGLQILTDPPGYCLCAWLHRRIFDLLTDLSEPPSQASAHWRPSGGRIEREALHLERYLPARNRHLYGRLGLAYRLDRPASLLVASFTLPRADASTWELFSAVRLLARRGLAAPPETFAHPCFRRRQHR